MRYGFVLPEGDARRVAESARAAEAAGWDGFFIPDRCGGWTVGEPGGGGDGDGAHQAGNDADARLALTSVDAGRADRDAGQPLRRAGDPGRRAGRD